MARQRHKLLVKNTAVKIKLLMTSFAKRDIKKKLRQPAPSLFVQRIVVLVTLLLKKFVRLQKTLVLKQSIYVLGKKDDLQNQGGVVGCGFSPTCRPKGRVSLKTDLQKTVYIFGKIKPPAFSRRGLCF